MRSQHVIWIIGSNHYVLSRQDVCYQTLTHMGQSLCGPASYSRKGTGIHVGQQTVAEREQAYMLVSKLWQKGNRHTCWSANCGRKGTGIHVGQQTVAEREQAYMLVSKLWQKGNRHTCWSANCGRKGAGIHVGQQTVAGREQSLYWPGSSSRKAAVIVCDNRHALEHRKQSLCWSPPVV